jgi:hypothetical protein
MLGNELRMNLKAKLLAALGKGRKFLISYFCGQVDSLPKKSLTKLPSPTVNPPAGGRYPPNTHPPFPNYHH